MEDKKTAAPAKEISNNTCKEAMAQVEALKKELADVTKRMYAAIENLEHQNTKAR